MIVQSLFFCIVLSTWLIDNQDNNNRISHTFFKIKYITITALLIPNTNIIIVNMLEILIMFD